MTTHQIFPERQCACGATFIPRKKWQRFCSADCRRGEWDRLHPRGGDNLAAVRRIKLALELAPDAQTAARNALRICDELLSAGK